MKREDLNDVSGSDELDVIVVGAGFAGVYMLHSLRQAGFKAKVFEAGSGIGGTWYWNRYPGARCDIESLEYSYKFSEELSREWRWTERYAAQPEICRYINFVADRLDLWSDIELNTRVTAARFDEKRAKWVVTTSKDGAPVSCRFVVMATGCLSVANTPKVEGLERFRGEVYHTGRWPLEPVDFTGKRVAVIGTGSSGIQAIPVIAEQAAQLTVFQRTANYSMPAANRPLTQDDVASYMDNFQSNKQIAYTSRYGTAYSDSQWIPRSALADDEQTRNEIYESRWQQGGPGLVRSYEDVLTSDEANRTLADFVRKKIHEIVRDPKTAEALCPNDHYIGSKRPCLDTNYYETYNNPHVSLVNLKEEPLERITEQGIRTAKGSYEFDVLVFATGFDAMTGAILAVDVEGPGGVRISEKWRDGPKTYLGVTVNGFPNLFIVTGPGSPSVIGCVVVSIEQHVEWITRCIRYASDQGFDKVEASQQAQEQWVAHVKELADKSLLSKANNWYLGANIPGKPRVFMVYLGGIGAYRSKMQEVESDGYSGFELSSVSSEAASPA